VSNEGEEVIEKPLELQLQRWDFLLRVEGANKMLDK
jgi:hypothetical protein